LSSEDEYYLTSLTSCLDFIHDLKWKDLNISQKNYEENIHRAKLREQENIENADLISIGGDSD
jgi:hypothetical protein